MSRLTRAQSRYLRLLELDEEPPSLEYLRRIVFNHICAIPFENVSKLLLYRREGMGRVTALDEYLDSIEHYDLGGTCYTCNPFLAELLRALGYDASLLGADMSVPDIHTVIYVHLSGRAYHVDAGYGGPFRYPLHLDELPQEIQEGANRFVVDRGPEAGDVQVSLFSGAQRLHGYRAHGPARSRDFFHQTILDSFQPGKTFMTCLRIVRIFPGHSVELHDRKLVTHRAGESRTTELASLAELQSAVIEQLGMPRCPIAEAVDILRELTGRGLFDAA